jgi:hypothetical protein
MALYLISYDIADKDAFEYGPLWSKLDALGAIKILYSEWVVPGEIGAASAIYDEIAPLTTQNDRLLVQEILKDARWDKVLIGDDAYRKLLARARG